MNPFLARLAIAALLAASAGAQKPADNAGGASAPSLLLPGGTVLYLELSRSIDAKKARPGDEISALLLADVVAHGKVVLREDSRLFGHVTEAQAHTGDNPESRLGIVFDKVVPRGSHGPILFRSVLLAVRPAPRLAVSSISGPVPPGMNPAGTPQPERHYPVPKASTLPAPASAGDSGPQRVQRPPSDTGSQTDREKMRAGGNNVDMAPTDVEGLSLEPSPDGVTRVVVSSTRTVKLESGMRLELRVIDGISPAKNEPSKD